MKLFNKNKIGDVRFSDEEFCRASLGIDVTLADIKDRFSIRGRLYLKKTLK